MTLPIILLVGNAGVGKDAAGAALGKVLGFKRTAQADAIKRIAKELFGFTDDQLWGPSSARNAIDSSWVQTHKFAQLSGRKDSNGVPDPMLAYQLSSAICKMTG